MARQLFVVAYDIRSDRRRRKLSILLEDLGGKRINKSVFECSWTPAEKRRSLQEAATLIDPETDQLACYPICRACYTRSEYLPEPPPPEGGPVRTI